MFKRLSSSWELVKASALVLQADKELIMFPIFSSISMILVLITFAFPTFFAGVIDGITSNGEIPIFGYIIAFLFYIVQYFVIFFFNSALVGAALIRLKGGDPTVSDGLQIAVKNIGSIIGYALISATVGVILKALSERAGFIGQIVISLIGLAWSLATYLVVPVLVVEETGPVEAVKRSAQLLKETWGEQVVGNFGIGTVFGLITFLVILAAIPLIVLAVLSGSGVVIGLAIVTIILAIMIVSLLNATLSGIYSAAVYNYAVEGTAGEYFDEALIQDTFRSK